MPNHLPPPPDRDNPSPLPSLEAARKARQAADQKEIANAVLREIAERQLDALSMYEPQKLQADFHASTAHIRILKGGNRSGKSTAGFVEDAKIVLQRDEHKKIEKRGGVLAIVAWDTGHIGKVVYPKLFKAGAFKMIRDRETGKWRTWRPWEEDDAKREKEVKPAPPLIPDRYIARDDHGRKKIAWYQKQLNIFTSVELVTGWTIWAFTSKGNEAQGFALDAVHIDEDIQNSTWAMEMITRTADEKGMFWWTALPHDRNEALTNLLELAEKQAEEEKEHPDCVSFNLPFVDNPYIPEQSKQRLMAEWAAAGDDVLRLRAYGDSGRESIRMYPSFSASSHTIERDELPNREIPGNWTRYVIIDPGHQPASVLFAAVPPPHEIRPESEECRKEPWGERCVIYDELQVLDSNAEKLAVAVRRKVMGTVIEDIIIDDHGSRAHETGSGKTIRQQYSDAFRAQGVCSERNRHGFAIGCDNIDARTETLRGWLTMRETGDGRRLMVLRDSCPKLIKEMERYKKKIEHRGGQQFVTNKPDTRGIHLSVCLEYLAAYNPKYVKVIPKQRRKADSRLARLRKKIAEEYRAEHGGNYVACSAGGK